MAGDGPDVLEALGDVSRETIERMERYRSLLCEWQARINLVGKDSLATFWSHHMADAVFLRHTAPNIRSWIDIGSGAGLPGIGLAILLAEGERQGRIDSVESDSRKCAFQRAAVLAVDLRRTNVDVVIHNRRAEGFEPTSPTDVLTARALAPLAKLLDLARTMDPTPSRLLLFKGANHEHEVVEARRRYRFDLETYAHPINEHSVLLDIRNLRDR